MIVGFKKSVIILSRSGFVNSFPFISTSDPFAVQSIPDVGHGRDQLRAIAVSMGRRISVGSLMFDLILSNLYRNKGKKKEKQRKNEKMDEKQSLPDCLHIVDNSRSA